MTAVFCLVIDENGKHFVKASNNPEIVKEFNTSQMTPIPEYLAEQNEQHINDIIASCLAGNLNKL